MSVIRRLFLWTGIVLLSAITLFLLNVGAHRLFGPNAEHAEAMALLAYTDDSRAEDGNAFPLMWMMPHAVPDADIERVTAEDVLEAEARVADRRPLADLVPADRPLLPAPDGHDPGLCKSHERGCIARVRTNPAATRRLVAAHGRWIERMVKLEAKEYYRYDLPITNVTPLPNPGLAQSIRISELALEWVDGNRVAALSAACRNTVAWRRLRHGTNSLVASMLAVAYLESSIDLVADMLAELPSDEVVPPECRTAFNPIRVEDVSICSEIRGEFRHLDGTSALIYGDRKRDSLGRAIVFGGLMPLVHSEGQIQVWASPAYAVACTGGTLAGSMTDQAFESSPPEISLVTCASAIVDCILVRTGSPVIGKYHERLLDNAARLRLAATLLWLRDTRDDTRSVVERFAERPDVLRSGMRESGIDADGRSIWVENFHDRRSTRSTLALAPEIRSVQ